MNLTRKQNILNFCTSTQYLIKKFQSNPFYFFYEEDVKAYLYSHLLSSFDEVEFSVDELFIDELGVDKIKSIPIKSEYPNIRNEISKFDIALLENNGNNHYEIDCSIVIELKLGSKIYDRFASFKDDLLKLLLYKKKSKLSNKLAIAIYFYQAPFNKKYINNLLDEFVFNYNCININQLELVDNEVCALIISSDQKIFYLQNISLRDNDL